MGTIRALFRRHRFGLEMGRSGAGGRSIRLSTSQSLHTNVSPHTKTNSFEDLSHPVAHVAAARLAYIV